MCPGLGVAGVNLHNLRKPLDPSGLPMSQTKPLIIDVHGHYTTAPKALEDWRNK